MSKKCELTGKIPLKGHKVSHANNKTKRRFLPNLKKVRFKSDLLKKREIIYVDIGTNVGNYLEFIKKNFKTRQVFCFEPIESLFKENIRLTVSNAGVRSVDKKGSFDQFVKSAKLRDLSPRLKKIKKSLLSKSA